MHLTLTEEEQKLKKSFELMEKKYQSRLFQVGYSKFEYKFHHIMQNPKNEIISFNEISRKELHNRRLSNLHKYFTSSNGEHICGKTVKRLEITNVCLKECHYRFSKTPGGAQHIAQLIAKKPNIEEIDLSNTEIGNPDAIILLNALKKNDKLIELKLGGNNISYRLISEIDLILANNKLIKSEPKTRNNLLVSTYKTGFFEDAYIFAASRDQTDANALTDFSSPRVL